MVIYQSTIMIKIEVDMTAKLPQLWIKVQYGYIPKYYNECCQQGLDEHNCWALHPELYDASDVGVKDEGKEKEMEKLGTATE
ncbi:hypothetical protein H5410_037880 [Solanum commersonii]|uniref:Uncharacterized protein n=1 Tax=Solanum commersonii TaxID=4109 RepID=A0A9J5YAS0_SOLCO|nr:hypothetical protein H5410_037880 [Solanum commersonii]